jgi:hypothetical protein
MNNKLEEQLSKLATPYDNFKAVFEALEEKRKTYIYIYIYIFIRLCAMGVLKPFST